MQPGPEVARSGSSFSFYVYENPEHCECDHDVVCLLFGERSFS